MIVYFSASTRKILDDVEGFRRIVNKIHDMGHTISNEWVEVAWLRAKGEHPRKYPNMEDLVYEAMACIERADLLITEASDSSTFGVGFETAFALQCKKPVLVLVKHSSIQNTYALGIKHQLLISRTYTDENLEATIEEFIKENTIKKKDLRFNFVIDRQIYNHLRLKSFQTGKTKAEFVRDLLIEDMKSS